ncbi:GIY-YIG nuclease family protein [Streptomyces sp. SID13031]|uniref:GIY-YIG nuclease family protein n=1 Tax=Streptomyces sp. SID13031 TaxID=2706046 RepID=UPI0013CA9571|nr:GIY-YIG nuclease family protein [Streptomyces sp. SID13031]NEA30115.1 GIY-YIG nuclease family protein [Streptomyces sp. SID13031]
MMKIAKKDQPPNPVRLIRAELAKLMAEEDPQRPGEVIGSAVGIYAYFDYDGEPIYVGQTSSAFRDRVGRHLTGQRSDAVAKFILDPFEVAYVNMWSIPAVATAVSLKDPTKTASSAEKKALLDPYEYTVYKKLEKQSRFGAVLNEGVIRPRDLVGMPSVVAGRIIPDELWEDRQHSDVRIARRAATISRLSQMISEREVSGGMRRTLLLQAQRLAWLAEHRIHEIGAEVPDSEDALISDE